MAEVVSLPSNGDAEKLCARVIRLLSEGRNVGLADETSYLVLRSAADVSLPPPFDTPASHASGALLLPFADMGSDCVATDAWSSVAERLSQRCWPGPVVLEFAHQGETLTNSLPGARAFFQGEPSLRLRSPAAPFLRQVVEKSPAPLLAVGEHSTQDSPQIGTAAKLVSQFGEQVDLIVDSGPTRFDQAATVVRLTPSNWEIRHAGVVGESTLAGLASQIVLFVCTGNTCRSPMAEAMFRHMIADRLKCATDDLTRSGYTIISAGLATANGMPPSPDAVTLLRQRGIDLSGHASQPATPDLLFVSDQIVTMTETHRRSIVSQFPELSDRVRLLSSDGQNVSDPFGSGIDVYEQCLQEIERHLIPLVDEFLSP